MTDRAVDEIGLRADAALGLIGLFNERAIPKHTIAPIFGARDMEEANEIIYRVIEFRPVCDAIELLLEDVSSSLSLLELDYLRMSNDLKKCRMGGVYNDAE